MEKLEDTSLIAEIVRGNALHLMGLRNFIFCRFADTPGTVALYQGGYSLRRLDVMDEAKAIQTGSEEITAAHALGLMIHTRELMFNTAADFFEAVTGAEIDFYGSEKLARPFRSALDRLQSPQA